MQTWDKFLEEKFKDWVKKQHVRISAEKKGKTVYLSPLGMWGPKILGRWFRKEEEAVEFLLKKGIMSQWEIDKIHSARVGFDKGELKNIKFIGAR